MSVVRKFSLSVFVVAALIVFSVTAAFAQIPTPEAITPMTYSDAVNGTIGILQALGIVIFIAAGIILMKFGPGVFKRFVGGGR